MWDVGGQKSLRSYWRNYFECTDGLIWVVDSADRLRLDTCRQELDILLQEERLAGATLLVLANKQDLPGSLSSNEIKEVYVHDQQSGIHSDTFDANFLLLVPFNYRMFLHFCIQILQLENINTHHWLVVGVSAVTGEKLLPAVDWLIDDIAKRIFTLNQKKQQNCTSIR